MTFRQIIGFSTFITLILLIFSEIVIAGEQQGSLVLSIEPALLTLLLSQVVCLMQDPDHQTHWTVRIGMTSAGLSVYWIFKSIIADDSFPLAALLGIQVGALLALLVIRAARLFQIQHET